MGASEDWARMRELRGERRRQPAHIEAKYRVRCIGCGIMMDWHGEEVCPDCKRKMSAPVGAGHGQNSWY